MAFDFPTAPAVDDPYSDPVSGAAYTYDGEKWVSAGSGGGGGTTPPAGGVPEAPIDTKQYGRQDAAWTEIAAAAAGDFLPLTGGTITGDLVVTGNTTIGSNLNAVGIGFKINFPSSFGQIELANYSGVQSTIFIDDGRITFAKPGGGGDIIRLIHATQVADFNNPPTVDGAPVVLMTQHEALKTEYKVALNAALGKITALEKRIAALEKRRV